MNLNPLRDIRCKTILPNGSICNRFLGKINGEYELKCPRCKGLITNKQYNSTKGD